MKPFDLEAAKRGEPIITRDGRAVKFIAHVPEANEGSRVIALVDGDPLHYYGSGLYYAGSEYKFDLFMAPRKRRTVWVNLYKNPDGDAFWHDTEQQADARKFLSRRRIGNKAHPIEIEE